MTPQKIEELKNKVEELQEWMSENIIETHQRTRVSVRIMNKTPSFSSSEMVIVEDGRTIFDGGEERKKPTPYHPTESEWTEMLRSLSGSVYLELLQVIKDNGFVNMRASEITVIHAVNQRLRIIGFGKYRLKAEKKGWQSEKVRKVILVLR